MTTSRFPASSRRFSAVVIVVTGLGLVLAACSGGSNKPSASVSNSASTTAPSSSSAPPSTSAAPSSSAAAAPVHIKLLESDGSTYGVGMPIIAYFSVMITDAKAFAKATMVKINGTDAGGAWYFEKSAQLAGYPMEGHYRPAPTAASPYWPAHATITMNMATQNVSAGPGLAFDDSLTLSMATGPANISNVDCATEQMVVTTDGTTVKTMPVSCGKAATATFNGVKVAMEKDNPEHMVGTPADPYDLQVPWSVRMTNSGEFVHAASWNGGNIGKRSTSNGCTNLNPADAQWYYNFTSIGDVVQYSNTGGGAMPVWDGYGDWNLPWSSWQTGGLLVTS